MAIKITHRAEDLVIIVVVVVVVEVGVRLELVRAPAVRPEQFPELLQRRVAFLARRRDHPRQDVDGGDEL